MYRIDEDTLIDESLVTCAEYQLFIDEMCAQGKFYHPDHWTSYQFPAGQAHAPILGVRPSDAQAFCEWLSHRQAGKWFYRLPSTEEAALYPLSKKDDRLCGYWTWSSSFAWVGSTPIKPRALAHKLDRDSDLIYNIVRDSDLTRDLARDLDRTRIRALARDSDLDRARDRALDRPLNLDHALDLDLDLDINLDRYIDRVLSFWVDLFTLQERIAGRSPAFEGIRLVKTRAQSQESQS